MLTLKGNGCAEGAAMGAALVKTAYVPVYTMDRVEDPQAEIAYLDERIASLAKRLDALYEHTLEESGEEAAELIESYQMILMDQTFFDGVRDRIRKTGLNCKMAIKEACEACRESFMAISDPYLRERFGDIEDVCFKLVMACDQVTDALEDVCLTEPTILVADTLTPMDTVRLDKGFLAGFIVERGGATSHAVILAKTLGIPAIVGVQAICSQVKNGSHIMMDAATGEIIVDGDDAAREAFQAILRAGEAARETYRKEPLGPAQTLDGVAVEIAVNAGDADSSQRLDPSLCDGVGLFRTEFLYMGCQDYPDEETQYQAYRQVAERMQGKPVIIRTLDIGGDKALDYMGLEQEENPFLGYRAIRICLDKPAMFKTQLRAILRASAYGCVKIMFPMIVSLAEIRQSRALLAECMAELRQASVPFDEDIAVGIMVETPAAVIMADQLAAQTDFFSIGTNDLTQYVTATDRGNARVQALYDPFNPAVLRAIYQTGQAATAHHILAGVCGETASMDHMIPFLIGAGIRELSVSQGALGKVRYLVRRLSAEQCEAAAKQIVQDCADSSQARAILAGLIAAIR